MAWRQMVHAWAAATVLMMAARAPGQTAPGVMAKKNAVTDEQVVAAMRRGVDFLLSKRQTEGNSAHWESGRWQAGGETALVLYALLHAGESLADDPVYGPKLIYRSAELQPAVGWLCAVEPDHTYMAALQACALTMLPRKPDDKRPGSPEAALEKARTYLVKAMGLQGGYTYTVPKERPDQGPSANYNLGDLSNAQYAALGMWALEEAGIKAPPPYWGTTDKFWRALQRPSGSWPYIANTAAFQGERDTMGIAGLATLFIAREFIDKVPRAEPKEDKSLDDGLAWLNNHFRADTGDLYYMYGVERVGLASGLRFFGTADWYRECAAEIVSHQNADGSWDAGSWGTRGFLGESAVTGTSFALLFLARGRNPVLFNKLQYDGPWNARPMDDAFVTRAVSRKIERPLNWQVVNLQVKGTDWLDAPVLLITGSKEPRIGGGDIEKIRAFIEGGGMVFSTADEGDAQFTAAIKRIAGIVSGGKYEMRNLPRTSPLLSAELNPSLTSPPVLLGMSNGIREVWVHSPADLGASWQGQKTAAVGHFEVAASIYYYVTGRSSLKAKLKPLEIAEPAVMPDGGGRAVTVARVEYGASGAGKKAENWDPEPGAWPRLAKVLRGQGEAGIDMKVVNVLVKDLDARKEAVAHLVATGKFNATGEDCIGLRKYLDDGGTLILEAGGGSAEALGSLTEMVAGIYPGRRAAPLPPGHAVYTGAFAKGKGADVSKIVFRKYGNVVFKQRIEDPAVDAVVVDGRARIFVLRYDVTNGLLGGNTWGVLGYAAESAERVAGNLVRWGMER